MIDLKKASKPRMMLRFLHQTKVISDEKFEQAMASNLIQTRPYHHADIYIQLLGWILIAAGIICLTAFNWFQLTDFNKLAIAETALIIAFIAILLSKKEQHKTIAGGIFSILIGSFWAVFGQIYQINSSIYHFTLVWGICLLPFAIVLRQQFITIVTALLLYSTLMMYLSLHHKIFWLHSSAALIISTLFTFILIFAKRLKVPSIASPICYIFFSMTLITLLGANIDLIFRPDIATTWLITFISSIIAIFILIHLNEKAMMVAVYLVTILIFFLRIISLPNMDVIPIMIVTSLCGVIAIYPTYYGAIKLINYANKVNQHAQP